MTLPPSKLDELDYYLIETGYNKVMVTSRDSLRVPFISVTLYWKKKWWHVSQKKTVIHQNYDHFPRFKDGNATGFWGIEEPKYMTALISQLEEWQEMKSDEHALFGTE